MNATSDCDATMILVEDIEWIRAAIRRELERNGFRVAEAHTVGEAISLAEEMGPAALVTEEGVPFFDTLVSRVRSHPTLQHLPVIIINPDVNGQRLYGGAVMLSEFRHIKEFLENSLRLEVQEPAPRN
jgi:PleD family two-component response regulator